MLNKKEMYTNLYNSLILKNRKGNLSQLLKDIVKYEFNFSDSSTEYDVYEKLIDENIICIKNRLETQTIPGVEIIFKTDEYVEIKVSNILSSIRCDLNKIEGDKFEELCEKILQLHISTNIKKTSKYSFEDKHCVDIIGDINIIDDIIAKAKLYAQVKNKIGEVTLNDLKEFIGGAKLVMSEIGRNSGYMHSYVLLYISATGFHKEAIEYMNKIGIIHIDGHQLAQLIKKYNINYSEFM